jgi:hypothetical protein
MFFKQLPRGVSYLSVATSAGKSGGACALPGIEAGVE